ncbi:MAG: hypothetical protein K2Y14_00610 [Burkholderiales bacterium]|nr:hypothetical protein [Burkholderiales bacterium]
MDVIGIHVKSSKLFKQVSQGGMLSCKVKIDGLYLQAQATRSTENSLVIVVSNRLSEPDLLVIYAKRWQLFTNLKSKGFNFENTHLTAKDRIGNLIKQYAQTIV